MAQNINQFKQTPEVGDIALPFNGQALSAQVGAAVSGTLVAGQVVKFVDVAGGVPRVQPLAANTDLSCGVVIRNLKDATYAANALLEIAIRGSIIYMTAGGAIARGARLEVVAATSKVITNGGTNPVFGVALDKAAADNDLIRVLVGVPN